MYLDLKGNIIDCPDDETGLYIQSRDGLIHHVSLPESSIGFQIGETSQIHTGGILQATPHAVRGTQSQGVTRESFALFMEPEFDGRMDLPQGKSVEDVQDASLILPNSVRTLASRWKQGMTFGEFSKATFQAFYETNSMPKT
jgi:isopenicillin N synthase-like dioxygenase